jgi:hypothetical protein
MKIPVALFSALQLCRGGAVLLPELVRDGQVGPALGPLRDHDDRRTLLHLLYLRPPRYGQTNDHLANCMFKMLTVLRQNEA